MHKEYSQKDIWGYVVNPVEKFQRGCIYCFDSITYKTDTFRPFKKDYDDYFEWCDADKKYREMVEFNREGYTSRTRKGIELRGITMCPYKECPYHELDNCESYNKFVESQGFKVGELAQMMSDWIRSDREVLICETAQDV